MEEGKDQEAIQPSTTPDLRHHIGKCKTTRKHHTREPRGQLFPSRLSQWCKEQTKRPKKDKRET